MKFEIDGKPSDLAKSERQSTIRARAFLKALSDGKLLSTVLFSERANIGASTIGFIKRELESHRVIIDRKLYWGNARTVAAAKERLNER